MVRERLRVRDRCVAQHVQCVTGLPVWGLQVLSYRGSPYFRMLAWFVIVNSVPAVTAAVSMTPIGTVTVRSTVTLCVTVTVNPRQWRGVDTTPSGFSAPDGAPFAWLLVKKKKWPDHVRSPIDMFC